MELYFAPLEGISGYIYRNAHHEYFPHMSKYFTPFISPNQNRALAPKEERDIHPDNNKKLYIVPQILTNNAEYFIRTAKELEEKYGYREVNLNLGCPSGTVAAKGKGAGFLAKKVELDAFLQEIFEKVNGNISIKTRIGKDSPDEFYELIEIFNKYPIYELIIHPRIQTDYYKNKPDRQVFAEAVRMSKNRLCYNGDIFTRKDYEDFCLNFPDIGNVMLGRGLLANPALAEEIMEAGKEDTSGRLPDKRLIRAFHDRLYADYKEQLSGETPVLFKMKELWFYMIHIFSDYEKYQKRIKKATRLCDYEEIIRCLFDEQAITELH